MALTRDIVPYWYQNHGPVRHSHAGTLPTGLKVFKGSVNMQVDGKIRKPVSGASMVALCTTIAGADGNGGLVLSARRNAVRVQLVAGVSKPLGITVNFGATIDVIIQQATDGGGAVTSTATQTVQEIYKHALASQLLRAKATGTGAGLTATTALTAIAYISLLGVAEKQLDNSAGGADLALPMQDGYFGLGTFRMTSSDAPALPTVVAVNDENTIKKTIDPLDLLVPVTVIEGSAFFCDLAAAF